MWRCSQSASDRSSGPQGSNPRSALPANVPERVDEVLAHVLGAARREGLSVEVAMTLWRTLIDWSICYEERLMGARALKGDSQGSADGDRSS